MNAVTRRQLLVGTTTFVGASLLGQARAHAHGAGGGPARSARGWSPDDLVTRGDWNADESIRTWDAEFSPVQVITVHHSALAVGDDGATAVRTIYHAHTQRRGWGDIGYHLLIDPDGVLYEGRYAGPDGAPLFGSDLETDGGDGDDDGDDGDDGDDEDEDDEEEGDEVVRCVTAGHVLGHNPGNIGICMMGDFTRTAPSGAATATLERTLAELCDLCGLDPTGTVTYVNPGTGRSRAARVITGHRDWTSTQCPGNAFAAQLAKLRTRVAERMR